MWISTVGRARLEVTGEMERNGEVVCKHHENVSQGQNDMTKKNIKEKTEERGVRYEVGLTWHKNRQSDRNTSKYIDKYRGKEHNRKTASAVFRLMFIF